MTLDRKFTDKIQEADSLNVVQKTVEILGPKTKNIVINPPVDSTKESLVQLADFVAGAIQAKYNNKDAHYAAIIKTKIIVEKTVKWVETKKRIVNP